MTNAPETIHPRGAALLTGAAVAAIAYAFAGPLGLPVLAFLPETGAWSLDRPEGAVAMTYYGRVLLMAPAFAAGYGAVRLTGRPRPSRALVVTAGALVLGALSWLVLSEIVHVAGRLPS